MTGVHIHQACPDDHPRIRAVCDHWWGRPVGGMLPRLFLDHFHGTSLVAEREEDLVGFLVGFLSPSQPEVAYVHFAAVAPEQRRTGLARDLYRRFADTARAEGRSVVRAITSPSNERSIAFHRALGFTVTGSARRLRGSRCGSNGLRGTGAGARRVSSCQPNEGVRSAAQARSA